jgi:hypothetical protein
VIESSRYGLAKLRWLVRPTGRVIRRIEPTRCGDLVHVDIKRLGKIPAGGVGGCSGPLSESAITRPTKAGQKSKHRHPVRSDSIRRGVPAGLEEIAQLGRTLWRRRHGILAFFDHHASNGPTEAINGRLEALRRNALGFRNLTHYRWRSLLHSGALHSLLNAL